MIFVTLGSQKFQFNRLLEAIDRQIESGVITDPVFAQTGWSDYQPAHYASAPFLDREEVDAWVSKSDVVIAQEQITGQFSDLGMILECRDCDELGKMIAQARAQTFRPYESHTQAYLDSIEKFLRESFDI